MNFSFIEKFNFQLFLSLIRALFPRWDFFDRIDYSFELQFKSGTVVDWQRICFDQKRKLTDLVFNPKSNLAMAQINILEHFAHDIQEFKNEDLKIKNLTSLKMTKSLLKTKLIELGIIKGLVQFRLVAISPNETVSLYISEAFDLDKL